VALSSANGTAQGFNPLCGDQVRVFLRIEDHGIQEASFTGTGCAICMASASLMTETLAGQSTEKALALCHRFRSAIAGSIPSDPTNNPTLHASLGKLSALLGVRAFPSRVKCATLPWHTLEAAIAQKATIESVSTEI
jgi:nitrogen fixation protein NifU and related proteins